MAVIELKDPELAERLQAAELAVVDFHVGRNADCILFKPKFLRLSSDYPHVAFFLVDSETAPLAYEAASPDRLPYFELFRYGQSLSSLSTSEERSLRAWLDRHAGR